MSTSADAKRVVPRLGLQGLTLRSSSLEKPPLSAKNSARLGTPRQTPRDLTGSTPRELGVNERTYRLEELSDSDDDDSEGSLTPRGSPRTTPVSTPTPRSADATKGAARKGVEPSENREAHPSEIKRGLDVAATDNGTASPQTTLAAPPVAQLAALAVSTEATQPVLASNATHEPAAVEGQVEPGGGEAARIFEGALLKEKSPLMDKDTVPGTKTLQPDVLDPCGDGYSPGTIHGGGAPPAAWDHNSESKEAEHAAPESPDRSPTAAEQSAKRMHPSPTPTIIDELMGDLVFETFTPRGPADDDVRRVRPMADLGLGPARSNFSTPRTARSLAGTPRTAHESESSGGVAPPISPGPAATVAAAAAFSGAAAAMVPVEKFSGTGGDANRSQSEESAFSSRDPEQLPKAGLPTVLAAVTKAGSGVSSEASPMKPPLPQDVLLPVISLPPTAPEKEREEALAASNEDAADDHLSPSVGTPTKDRDAVLFTSAAGAVASDAAWPPSPTALSADKEVALPEAIAEAAEVTATPPRSASATASVDDTTQGPTYGSSYDLAPGVPLTPVSSGVPLHLVPLAESPMTTATGDLAPGPPVTPAPSQRLGRNTLSFPESSSVRSADINLAPGPPITPAPSQALLEAPRAPPPTPAEGLRSTGTPTSAMRAIPGAAFLPPTPPPTPADSLGVEGLYISRPGKPLGGFELPASSSSPLSSRAPSSNMAKHESMGSGLDPGSASVASAAIGAVAGSSPLESGALFKPGELSSLSMKSGRSSDCGSDSGSAIMPHGIGLKSADSVAITDLQPTEFSGSRSHTSRQSDTDSGPPPAPSASRRASAIALAASLEGQPISLADASPFVSLAGSTGDIFHLDPLEESPLEDAEADDDDEAEAEHSPPLNAALASAGAPLAPIVEAQTQGGGGGKTAAIAPVVLTGEHAAPMTPRTRARNPMQDIVSMITTGSARKEASSAATPTSAVLGGAAVGGAALAGAGIIAARSNETEAAVHQQPVAAPSANFPLADSQGGAAEGGSSVEGTNAPKEPTPDAVTAAGTAGERHIAAVEPAAVSAVTSDPPGILGAIPDMVPEPAGSTAGTAGSVVEPTPPSSQPTSLSNGADLADADLLMLQQEEGGDEFAVSHATPPVVGKVVTLGEAEVLPGDTAAGIPASGETESVLGHSAPSENYSTISVAGSNVSNVASAGEVAEVSDLAETPGALKPASQIPHSMTSTTVQGGAITTNPGMSPDEVAVVLGKDPTGVQTKTFSSGADAADAALKKLQLDESVLPAEAAPSAQPTPAALVPRAEGVEEGSQVSVPQMLPEVVSNTNPGKSSMPANFAANAAEVGGEGEATAGKVAELSDLAETPGALKPASQIPHSLTSTTVQRGPFSTNPGMSPDEVAVVLGKDPTGVQTKTLSSGADAADAALEKLQHDESVLPAEAVPSAQPTPAALVPVAEGVEEGSQVSVPQMLPEVVSNTNPGKSSMPANFAANAAEVGGEGEESTAVGVPTQGVAVEPIGDIKVPTDQHEIPASKEILSSPATTIVPSEPAKEGKEPVEEGTEPANEAADAGTTQEGNIAGEGGESGVPTPAIVPLVINSAPLSSPAAVDLPPVAAAVQASGAAKAPVSEAAVSPFAAQSQTLELLPATQATIENSPPDSNQAGGSNAVQEIEAVPSVAVDAGITGGGNFVQAQSVPNIRKRGRTPAEDSVGKTKSCICQ